MQEIILKIASNPLFGIAITLVAFLLASALAHKLNHPVFHPLWIAAAMIIALLLALKIPYDSYMEGGQYVHLLLQPATVLLALPLYRCLQYVKENLAAVLSGIVVGVLSSFFTIYGLSRILPIGSTVLLSTYPKSITTPIALALCETLGGLESITAASVLVTGIFGCLCGPFLCRLTGIHDPIAVGVAMGTSCHAIGTSRAMELGEAQGAFSGLSIGIAGITTVLIVPLLLQLFPV